MRSKQAEASDERLIAMMRAKIEQLETGQPVDDRQQLRRLSLQIEMIEQELRGRDDRRRELWGFASLALTLTGLLGMAAIILFAPEGGAVRGALFFMIGAIVPAITGLLMRR